MIRKKPYDIHTAFNSIIFEDVNTKGSGNFATIKVLDESGNIVATLKKERLNFLINLSKKPGQAKFRQGWVNRVNSF